MRDKILEKLNEIERAENVRILYCAESGSRAWGFASPDSDYDVRFIYVRPHDFYLRLDKTRDVIEWQLDNVFDVNGWDVQKALRLLYASNPTLLEWSASPVTYRTTEDWERLSQAFPSYFRCKTGLWHYLSMARHNNHEFLQSDEVKLKKYFYVLRPILACRWILSEGTPPPMLFTELMTKYLDSEVRPEVEDLLEKKMDTPEMGTGRRIDKLNDYIDRSIARVQAGIDALPDEPARDWDKLNKLFLSLL